MRKKGARNVANVFIRSRTVAIEVCLSFNLVVISNFNGFPFPLSKAKFLSNITMNRQTAANLFAPVLNYFCYLFTDSAMYLALLSNAVQLVQFCCINNFQFLYRNFFSLFPMHRVIMQDDSLRQ
jgi:hypothetical protein